MEENKQDQVSSNQIEVVKEKLPVKEEEIYIADDGSIQTKTLRDLYRYSFNLLKSGMLPKGYDTPEKVMAAITLAKELNLPPLNALKNISVINGTACIWGELPLAICRRSGLLVKIDEFCIDKEYKKICFENKNIDTPIFAAICCIQRKSEDEKTYHYSALDAEKNPNSKNQVWNSNRSIMMKRRARSIALKDVFGDYLGGIAIAEYDFDTIPGASDGGSSITINKQDKKIITASSLLSHANIPPKLED